MRKGAAALAFVALSYGCATPSERVVLLPGANGKTGAVVVRAANQEVTLDTAFASVEIAGGSVTQTTLSEQEVSQRYETALAAQPPRPQSYLLFFTLGQPVLTPDSLRRVEEIKLEIANRPAPDVLVVGHADRMGTEGYNEALSYRRALVVRDALLSIGVPAAAIEVVARGECDPLVPTEDGMPEPSNRRVEITVR